MLHQVSPISRIKRVPALLRFLLDGIQHVLILIAFLMFFSFVQVATAGDRSENGLLMHSAQSDTNVGEITSAHVVKTDIDMRISGMINRVQVVQVFKNPTTKWLDGTYLFPLPDTAVVDSLRIFFGERVINAEVVERKEAKTRYRKAKKSGQHISLLEQHRPNLFSTSIANIGPGQQIRIEISFQHRVRFEQGEFRLRMPMAVIPRYSSEMKYSEYTETSINKLDSISATAYETPSPSQRIKRKIPLSMHIELDAGFPLQELDSRYHAVRKVNHGLGRYSIQLKHASVLARRDLELYWRPEPGQLPRTAVFHERLDDQHYYFVMVYPPEPGMVDEAWLNKEVVFVVDTSGSMAGAAIRQARSALLLALKDLDPEDTFNVITFNNTTHSLFYKSKPASVLNISRARQFVAQINASGGTKMLPALAKALAVKESEHKLRQIIYLTDGAIINEQSVFKAIRSGIQSNRLFTVGIGSSPNSHFLHKAALAGRGTYTYIGNVNEVKTRLNILFKKINRPVLHDLSIAYHVSLSTQRHLKIQDLYEGEPLMFTLKTNGESNLINITGYRSNQSWVSQLNLSDSNPGSGIAKYWAYEKIDAYMDEFSDDANKNKAQKNITELALKYKILSPYTSLLVNDKPFMGKENTIIGLPKESSPVSALDIVKESRHGIRVRRISTVKLHQVIPLYTQTATDSQLKLIIGGVSLLIAILLKIYLRRRDFEQEVYL